ncbi:hypothetical protein [Arsenophonus nasoniae]|uniref:hypothetical protein n=1 Tax=Arsenophonus nasoniae TaxID=638 RepID=UPI003879FE43
MGRRHLPDRDLRPGIGWPGWHYQPPAQGAGQPHRLAKAAAGRHAGGPGGPCQFAQPSGCHIGSERVCAAE